MTKFHKIISATVLMGAMVTLAACEKEGPAERAGKEVDQAVTQTGQQIEKAGDKIQEAATNDK